MCVCIDIYVCKCVYDIYFNRINMYILLIFQILFFFLFVGKISDITQSYDVSFYSAGITESVVAFILFVTHLCLQRNHQKWELKSKDGHMLKVANEKTDISMTGWENRCLESNNNFLINQDLFSVRTFFKNRQWKKNFWKTKL